jgi:DHA2 family multidrug resistance protein
MLEPATRARLAGLAHRFMTLGVSDPDLARHKAIVAVGLAVRRQASIMAYSDAVILQSALLGLAFVAVLFLKRSNAQVGAAH